MDKKDTVGKKMSRFVGGEEKIIDVNDQIVFENKTDSIFGVDVGIIFHESGLYDISISGNRVIVTKVANRERKRGKWIDDIYCSECGWVHKVESGFIGSVKDFNYCPNCGADMREETEDE